MSNTVRQWFGGVLPVPAAKCDGRAAAAGEAAWLQVFHWAQGESYQYNAFRYTFKKEKEKRKSKEKDQAASDLQLSSLHSDLIWAWTTDDSCGYREKHIDNNILDLEKNKTIKKSNDGPPFL